MENECDHQMTDSESPQNSDSNSSEEVSKLRKIWDDEFLEAPLQERTIDPEILHDDITRLVLRNDLPLRFVEYDEFRDLISYLCPAFNHIDINTLTTNVQKLYDKECQGIKDLLKSSVGRVSLSTESWTSITNDVHMSFTAHYIDKDWVLHKKLLGFCIVPFPHTNADVCDCITKMLVDWGIDNKLFSITVDNAESNDMFVELLKTDLNLKNALLCNGDLFHKRSCAHILNLIVQDTLKWIDDSIQLIRESVKFVGGSEVGKSSFLESCKQLGIPTNTGLHGDVSTRWTSTYHMLESALFYQRAFLNLQLMDSNYKDCPSAEEWLKIVKIVKCLKPFKDLTTLLSGLNLTSNLNFLYAWKIHKSLLDEISSEDCFMKKVAEEMKEKYDKYWNDNNLILAIALVFDPRYKFGFVKWAYSKLSVNESEAHEIFSHVKCNLYRHFKEYEKMVDIGGPSKNDGGTARVNKFLEEFHRYLKEENGEREETSQLDQYLEEARSPVVAELDVLAFWNAAQYQYPELARMARDVLAVPFSTVESELAFLGDCRVIDKCRSKLLSSNAETLVCLRNWMYDIDYRAEPIDDAEELADALRDVLTTKEKENDVTVGSCDIFSMC